MSSQTNCSLGTVEITYEVPNIKCFSWNSEGVFLQTNLQAHSHLFLHLFKLVSEVFAFASPPKVDGNMITEMIPPVGLVQHSPLGVAPFEVCWSSACTESTRRSPWGVALSFFFPWVGQSSSIPVCFAPTGTDYLVSFELDVFLSNILDICCLTSVFVLCAVCLW